MVAGDRLREEFFLICLREVEEKAGLFDWLDGSLTVTNFSLRRVIGLMSR